MELSTIQDDRTDEQRTTHTIAFGGIDSFLSGWGGGLPTRSYAYWACEPEDADAVARWVKSRGDIRYVRQIDPNAERRVRKCDHVHIYAIRPGHPALNEAD